ncbi:MAG: hypothetical protein E4G90_04570 [Gemmatimonadales bacterium]|nr:MAG: hypothetical protein E4G90_04570 [Gemmatimonadales bacterium]
MQEHEWEVRRRLQAIEDRRLEAGKRQERWDRVILAVQVMVGLVTVWAAIMCVIGWFGWLAVVTE